MSLKFLEFDLAIRVGTLVQSVVYTLETTDSRGLFISAAYSETFEEGPDTLSVPYLDRLDGDTNRAAAYNEKFTSYDDWQDNPESIPKGEGYYEHDTRDRNDMTYWERKQLFITTGRQFPMTNRGFRGRPGFTPRFRGRGFIRGGGRGFTRGIRRGFNNYNYRGGSFRGSYPNQRGTYPNQRGTYPNQRGTYSHYSNDDWKHDKYADLEKGEGEDQNQEETSKDEYEDVNQSNNAKNSISKSGDLKRKSEGSNGKVKTKDKKVKKDKKHKEHKKDKVKSKEKAKSHDNKNVKESGDYLEKGDKSKTDVGKQYELEIKEEVSIS